MKPYVLALSLLAGSAAAEASEQGHYSLFTHAAHERDIDAEHRIDKVLSSCAFSEMSRIGPSEAQRSACKTAEHRAQQLGTRTAQAAIDRLDDELVTPSIRWHLYALIGHTGDLRFVAPLVGALEREEKAGLGNSRRFERAAIVQALTGITYAAPKGTPAIQWRKWADAHEGATRDQLLTERLAEVEATLLDGCTAERIEAMAFLASQPRSRARGLKLLEDLQKEELTQREKLDASQALYRARAQDVPDVIGLM